MLPSSSGGLVTSEDIEVIVSFLQDSYPFPELFIQADGSLGCLGKKEKEEGESGARGVLVFFLSFGVGI